MKEQVLILSRLLDKYENSKHLLEPGSSLRRVMLRVEKKELPEYRYEEAAVRDAYNKAARALERQQLVQLEWVKGRPVLSALVLNLEQIMACYAAAGRVHPKARASEVIKLIQSGLEGVKLPWILAWQEALCAEAAEQLKIPAFCKREDGLLEDLLLAFREYAALSGSITMRAFSSKCFHDSKYFERNVRELFLLVARKYDADLALACEENDLGEKEQLAFLGIYARPELYELAGNCRIHTEQGTICVGAAAPYGLALPSTLIDGICALDLEAIQCITFIENKTNYDEYLLSEKGPGELVLYHGGFLSPQKRKLFALIAAAAPKGAPVHFWADIDRGGFQMFEQLQKLFPALEPLRMSGDFVDLYHQNGLRRTEQYLSKLQESLEKGQYPLFRDAIAKILLYGVTIEQESFLG